jgi:Holliday junction resolvase
MLDPAPDGDVVNGEPTFRHHLLQIAVCERVSKVPPNAQEDDHVFKMSSAEECWPFSGHDTPYQITATAFATEPGIEFLDERQAGGEDASAAMLSFMSIDPSFYKIYEALEQAGWKSDPKTLEAALRKLNYGIPAQDEFCLLVSWLGRCKLIHGLAQQQYPPASRTDYQVPDFFAVFNTAAGPVPVLIEVKAKMGTKLSWRPNYYEPLQRYGEILGLPVLVAWKETRGGMWSLVDISMFAKARQNYNLSFNTAMQNSLMSMLAGDFMIEFAPGFGIHLHYRKVSEDDSGFHCVVEEAYFLGADGTRFSSLKGGLWPFFLTLDAASEIEETETHIHQSFTVREKCGAQFAHRGFPALFATRKGKRWRSLLEEHQFSIRPQDLQDAAREAFEYSATSKLMRLIPHHIPPHLEKAAIINSQE